MERTAYQQALDYLFGHIDYSKSHAAMLEPENFDLGRVYRFMERLGNPHQAYPVIHIAGSKGKGSTAALCASALQAARYRVGLYTSPHVEAYTERFRIDGREISQASFVELVSKIKPAVRTVADLTAFEIEAGLAFWHFARSKIDVAVIEVGLGGRLDATNVVMPVVSVITPISYDHVPILGSTLAEIAAEKGGIIKPGRPLVLAPQPPEAARTLQQIAVERGAPLCRVGSEIQFEILETGLSGQRLTIIPAAPWSYVPGAVELEIPLLGPHQAENAATALAALLVGGQDEIRIDLESIRTGFARVAWPGRFEILQREPPLIIDAAHNRHSALRLRQTLDQYFSGYPVHLVFGALADKDVGGMLEELAPRLARLYACQSENPRRMPAAQIAAIAEQLGLAASVHQTIPDAVHMARQRQAAAGGLVLATGSLTTAGAVRTYWREMSNAPQGA